MKRGLALRWGTGLLLLAALVGALWWLREPRDEPPAVIAPVALPLREPGANSGGAGPAKPAPGPNAPIDPPPAPAASADSEQALLDEARQRLETDPAAALALIERADRSFGSANEARRALAIDVHVRLGRIGAARSLADQFYRSFPDSSEIARIERLTGYHPRPYGPPKR